MNKLLFVLLFPVTFIVFFLTGVSVLLSLLIFGNVEHIFFEKYIMKFENFWVGLIIK